MGPAVLVVLLVLGAGGGGGTTTTDSPSPSTLCERRPNASIYSMVFRQYVCLNESDYLQIWQRWLDFCRINATERRNSSSLVEPSVDHIQELWENFSGYRPVSLTPFSVEAETSPPKDVMGCIQLLVSFVLYTMVLLVFYKARGYVRSIQSAARAS
jgi:hypothetical protein